MLLEQDIKKGQYVEYIGEGWICGEPQDYERRHVGIIMETGVWQEVRRNQFLHRYAAIKDIHDSFIDHIHFDRATILTENEAMIKILEL